MGKADLSGGGGLEETGDFLSLTIGPPGEKEKEECRNGWNRIGDDAVLKAMSFASATELAKLGCTCRYLSRSSSDGNLWSRLYVIDFTDGVLMDRCPSDLGHPLQLQQRPSLYMYKGLLRQLSMGAASNPRSRYLRAFRKHNAEILHAREREIMEARNAKSAQRKRDARRFCLCWNSASTLVVMTLIFTSVFLLLLGPGMNSDSTAYLDLMWPWICVVAFVALLFVAGCVVRGTFGSCRGYFDNIPNSAGPVLSLMDYVVADGYHDYWKNTLFSALNAGCIIVGILLLPFIIVANATAGGSSWGLALLPFWMIILCCCCMPCMQEGIRELDGSEVFPYFVAIFLCGSPIIASGVSVAVFLDGGDFALHLALIPVFVCLFVVGVGFCFTLKQEGVILFRGQNRDIQPAVLFPIYCCVSVFVVFLCTNSTGTTDISLAGLFVPLELSCLWLAAVTCYRVIMNHRSS